MSYLWWNIKLLVLRSWYRLVRRPRHLLIERREDEQARRFLEQEFGLSVAPPETRETRYRRPAPTPNGGQLRK